MQSRPTLLTLALLFSAATLQAQAPTYSVELSDGTSGHAILTNKSGIAIEAFRLSGKCDDATGGIGMNSAQDILESPGNDLMSAIYEERRKTVGGLAPWAQTTLNADFSPQQSGCTWKPRIDAVLYGDGTYAGDKDFAQYLQAKRDGLAASLQYWLSVFQQEHQPLHPDLLTINAEAKKRSENEKLKPYSPQLSQQERGYWAGRHQVDANIVLWSDPSSKDPELMYKNLHREITRWNKELEANQAFKTLAATFRLPPELQKLNPEYAKAP